MPTPVASWTIIRLLFILTTPSASPIILKRLTLFTGGLEFGFLLFIAFLLFGPKKLPEIARTLGKGMAELRRASNELKSSLEEEIKNLDRVPEHHIEKLEALNMPAEHHQTHGQRGCENEPNGAPQRGPECR